MKNDFDFIKDKFDSSGVNAPEKMDESFVLDKIGEENPKIVDIKKAKPYKKYSLVAACALFLTVAVAASTMLRLSKTPASSAGDTITYESDSTLYRFSDRAEVMDVVEKLNKNRNDDKLYALDYEYDDIADIAYGSTEKGATFAKNSASADHGETYTQVSGIDEADIVKTDGNFIYVANYDSLCIFRANGKNTRLVTKITIAENKNLEESIQEIYVANNRLTVIYDIYKTVDTSTDDEATFYSRRSWLSETRADVYDCSDAVNLVKLNSFSQSGYYVSSRMIGDSLYLVSNKYDYNDSAPLPYVICGNDYSRSEVPANCVYCVEEPTNSSFVVVSEFNTADAEAQPVTRSVLGSSSEIYCSSENLYVTCSLGRYYGGLVLVDGEFAKADEKSEDTTPKTQIIKFSLNHSLDVAASTKVKGYIDNQYSLDESGGKLRIATTSSDKNGKDENNLFVLDENLGQLGSVTGFAKNESIKAVRYVGDTAYVITYEETDPLFVIDLSDNAEPKILGSVKISGFSSMLVPIDENTILGIGYHTQEEDWNDEMEIEEGLKLALFDVSDKSSPKVLDSKIFKDYYSEVQNNPKALLVNSERGNFSIPFSYWGNTEDEDEVFGAITFSVKDGKISIDQTDMANVEANRCTYIGDTLYMIATFIGDDDSTIDCVRYK